MMPSSSASVQTCENLARNALASGMPREYAISRDRIECMAESSSPRRSAHARGFPALQVQCAREVPISDHGNPHRRRGLRDDIPISVAAIALLLRPAMHRNGLHSAVLENAGSLRRVDGLRVPTDPDFR